MTHGSSGDSAEHADHFQRYTSALHLFMRSLRLTGNTNQVVAMVTDETPPLWRELMKIYAIVPYKVQMLRSTGQSVYYSTMVTKLHLWNMTAWRKVAYYDIDRVFMRDPQQVFDLCNAPFCAVRDAGVPGRYFNAGFFVTYTSQDFFKQLLANRHMANSVGLAEQDMLNKVFADWRELPQAFNLMPKGYTFSRGVYRDALAHAVSIHEKFWQARGCLHAFAAPLPHVSCQ